MTASDSSARKGMFPLGWEVEMMKNGKSTKIFAHNIMFYMPKIDTYEAFDVSFRLIILPIITKCSEIGLKIL